MLYQFKREESVPQAVRRIAHSELDSAAGQLQNPPGGNYEEAVHEARKSVKKVRALLRLFESELAGVYGKEAGVLRDIGRKLSKIRDRAALIEGFDQIEPKNHSLDSVRSGLIANKEHADEGADLPEVLKKIAEPLRKGAKRVKFWPLHGDGFQAFETGLEQGSRRARRAFAAAQKHRDPEHFHEWRKRVKDHWYHVRLLENLWTEVLRSYESDLKDLETCLGDDHNLVLLRECLTAEPDSFGKEKTVEATLELIDKRQKELRQKALALGAKIHQEKPKQFAKRMGQLWETWQSGPTQAAKD